jgi:hypothetical protein
MRLSLLALLALGLSAATAVGCGGDDETPPEATPAETAATATPATTSKPIRCLDAAGLTAVEGGGAGRPWSGSSHDSTYRIVVHKLAKPARAPRVVAGEYAVTGSFKVVAVGRGLTGDEGLQADALVQTVADCLGG